MKTKWLLLVVVLTGTITFWGCGGSNPSGLLPGTELEGTWRYSDTDYRLTFTFSDSNWTVLEEYLSAPETTFTWDGTFTLNTTVSPKHIDLLCASSPYSGDIGLTALGIYALNSTATACTLANNDFGDTVRPVSFGTYPLIVDKQ
ncbi:MAG: hypothetical protein K8S24_08560 [Candidatus Aegiribacteria sp.]|nr:hypothetical protein [Candidatus Aegiribacteria sp.]